MTSAEPGQSGRSAAREPFLSTAAHGYDDAQEQEHHCRQNEKEAMNEPLGASLRHEPRQKSIHAVSASLRLAYQRSHWRLVASGTCRPAYFNCNC